ncbi:hypothetical protein K474DRAFT_1770193 [Panus rudis PR-1116 ss-1]|nr:hypothetical protein K474DRAFT_1770193 [Panus rudis PR-1116 ss-1]
MKSTNLFFAVLALFIGSNIATPIAAPGEFDAVYNYNDVKRKDTSGYDATYYRLYKRQDSAPDFDAAYKAKVYSRQDAAPGFDEDYNYVNAKRKEAAGSYDLLYYRSYEREETGSGEVNSYNDAKLEREETPGFDGVYLPPMSVIYDLEREYDAAAKSKLSLRKAENDGHLVDDLFVGTVY